MPIRWNLCSKVVVARPGESGTAGYTSLLRLWFDAAHAPLAAFATNERVLAVCAAYPQLAAAPKWLPLLAAREEAAHAANVILAGKGGRALTFSNVRPSLALSVVYFLDELEYQASLPEDPTDSIMLERPARGFRRFAAEAPPGGARPVPAGGARAGGAPPAPSYYESYLAPALGWLASWLWRK